MMRKTRRRARVARSPNSEEVQSARELTKRSSSPEIYERRFGRQVEAVSTELVLKEEIRRLLHSLARRGAAVIVSTDDLWELEPLTDRILVIGRGVLKAEFPSKSMRHAEPFAAVTGLEATGAEPLQTNPAA